MVIKIKLRLGTYSDVLQKEEHTFTHSVALDQERTIPTERPPLVEEASANFC
jgi:hypothetical protein